MKLLTKPALTAIALLGTLPATFAGPRAEHARHEAKRQAQREETAEKERRWSHYLTDAGALGPIGWKESTCAFLWMMTDYHTARATLM